MGEWTLHDAPGGMTRVEYRYETQPAKLSDRLMELVAGRGWWKRKLDARRPPPAGDPRGGSRARQTSDDRRPVDH